MAYRKIHDNFWTDPDIEELTPEQKFFYIYLITNPNVNQLGLYEFSIRRAVFETGYNRDTIEKLLAFFESIGKIKRSEETKEFVIIKFYYHNKSNSPKAKTHIESLLKEVKDTSLIQYIYGMHTLSQEEEEEEEEEEKEKEEKEKEEKEKEEVQYKRKQAATVPTLSDVQEYFKQKGYGVELASKFYEYYNEPMKDRGGRVWKDQKGNTVVNWKQKALAVWMKEDNKTEQQPSYHKFL